MALAKSALRDLDQAYDLFSQVGEKARVDRVLVRYFLAWADDSILTYSLARFEEIEGPGACCDG